VAAPGGAARNRRRGAVSADRGASAGSCPGRTSNCVRRNVSLGELWRRPARRNRSSSRHPPRHRGLGSCAAQRRNPVPSTERDRWPVPRSPPQAGKSAGCVRVMASVPPGELRGRVVHRRCSASRLLLFGAGAGGGEAATPPCFTPGSESFGQSSERVPTRCNPRGTWRSTNK
jgi:hypothetical protein